MAVTCAKCGRQYDVTLFQFGRTINCACGGRVGFEHKLNLPVSDEIKFFADVMLARVVRLLRAIGVDTRWEDAISDADLVRKSIAERRFILTLDKKLAQHWRTDNVFLLTSEKPFEQFREIVGRFEIVKPSRLFTRCLICNTVLRKADKNEIARNLAPEIREKYKSFNYCAICNKIYWKGSHTRRMREAIEKVFDKLKVLDK